MTQSPLLNVNNTILWLKAVLSVVILAALYYRYKWAEIAEAASRTHALRTKAIIVLMVAFSFGVFHNFGTFRGGSFTHYGEMFHYYLGSKYFKELGYYELYNAVIAADTEQGNVLADLPFFTDLRTYQNTHRGTVLRDVDRIRGLFSKERWSEFKGDVAFFKKATDTPGSPGLFFLLMDHGYNGSPVSTFVLGLLTNAVPVSQLQLLAFLDVVLVVAMGVLVFRAFGFPMGALFSVYFCVNALNVYDYLSGSILRYDWLFYAVAAVCLLERKRYASSAIFFTLSAMTRLFPALLLYGIAVKAFQNVRAARAVDRKHIRFVVAAGFTGLALFLLPAASLGSVLQPWKDFSENTRLHNSGVYVNHLGLRGVVLFEPSHLSLERFVETYKTSYTNDIVRHWQDVKENEFQKKVPAIVFVSLLVLVGLTAIICKRDEVESVLWPLLLVYAVSYPAHYYYAFLCLFILLFFRRSNSRDAFVPLSLLLVFNVCVLVADYFGPSPIVFYTVTNICLFICLSSIFGFELYAIVARKRLTVVASLEPQLEPRREVKRRRPHRKRKTRARGK